MTAFAAARPHPSTFGQWWVLTARLMVPAMRNGELLTALISPAAFTAAFYVPLHDIMARSTGGISSYAQYLMPMIGFNAIAFASVIAGFRAATDSLLGINRRFGSMPIAPLTPLGARMSASLCRCSAGLTSAIVCGHVIGVRFYGGPQHLAGFFVLMLAIGAALSFLVDVTGTISRNPQATAQWMLLPQIILGMLSVGIQPVEQFPRWIQPIVRDQAVSQFTYSLRALVGDSTPAAGSVSWSVMGPSLAWISGVVAVTALFSAVALRRRR
jgi:ABC-2 type transport system permease protein